MLLHFTIQQQTQHESSTVLREQILDLSKRYIKALAEENKNVVDGPYVGTVTAYGKCMPRLCDTLIRFFLKSSKCFTALCCSIDSILHCGFSA